MAGAPVRVHEDIDKGYAWWILLAVFMNHVIVDGLMFSFGIFKIEFEDYFQKGAGQTSLVGSILSATALMTAPIASILVNRFGCRPVAIAGSLIATVGFGCSTFCTTITALMVTYGVIAGIGLGLLYLPSVVAVTFYFEKRRALATGIAVCGSGVGCFIFAPLGDMLLKHYDWKNGMLFVAGITLQGCIFGGMLRPLNESKSTKKNVVPIQLVNQAEVADVTKPAAHFSMTEASDGEFRFQESNDESHLGSRWHAQPECSDIANSSGDVRRRSASISSARSIGGQRARRTSGTAYPVNPNATEDALRGEEALYIPALEAENERGSFCRKLARTSGVYLLTDPLFLIPFLCNLIASVGLFVPFFYIANKAINLGVEKTMASYLLSVIGISNTLSRIVTGIVADMEHVSALLLHNLGLVLAGLLCIFSMFAVNYAMLCVYCVLFGICYAAWMTLTSVVLCELLGLGKLTHAFGLLTLARGLSTLIGPPLAGFVYDSTNNYSNAMHVGGFALLFGGLTACLLHLPVFQKRKDNEEIDCLYCYPSKKNIARKEDIEMSW